MALYTITLPEIQAMTADKQGSPSSPWTGNYCKMQGSNTWYYRTFLQYDLSLIPIGAEVISAKLKVYCSYWNDSGGSGTTNISRVTQEWDETTLTWNNQPTTTGTYLESNVRPPSVGTWSDWDITNLVTEWVNETYPNYGLYIKNNNEGSYRVDWNISCHKTNDGNASYIEVEYEYSDSEDSIVGSGNLLLESQLDLNNWRKNMTSFPVFQNNYVDGVNTLQYQGGGEYERIYTPITVEANRYYQFKFQLHSPTGFTMGNYGSNYEFAFIRTSAPTDTNGALTNTNLSYSENWDTSASNTPKQYTIGFSSGTYTRLYVAFDFGYILDGVTSEYVFSDFELRECSASDLNLAPYDYVFDFTDPNWKTKYPINYSVSDNAYPFYANSTFTYDSKLTLRSGGIGHSGTSLTTINFTLAVDGSIEFNYTVSSENNYDWLTITLDGTQIVRRSGSLGWTVFNKELTVGTHTLELKYTKDGSASSGSDAGAIGYLKILGMSPPFDTKYLIRCNSTLYTIVDDSLVPLEESYPQAEIFRTYGFDEVLEWNIISQLVNPEILYWFDSNNYVPTLTANMVATSFPQNVISNPIDLSDPTITGIELMTVNCEGNPLIAVSFNDKQTWHAWNGTEWSLVSEEFSGMTKELAESLTYDEWMLLYTGASSFYIRVSFTDLETKLTEIYVDFAN